MYKRQGFNVVFASNQNDVAITSAGHFPLKWKEQGKYSLDGSNPEHEWKAWIPVEQTPYVKNPARGFVSSANQFPADPSYPYYLGWKFAPAERGIRINERLGNMTKATPDSLRLLQNDNFNVEARRILPELLKYLEKDPSAKALPAYGVLAKWNLRNCLLYTSQHQPRSFVNLRRQLPYLRYFITGICPFEAFFSSFVVAVAHRHT